MNKGESPRIGRHATEDVIHRLRRLKLSDPVSLPIDDLIRAAESLRERDSTFVQLAENLQEVLWVGSPDWQRVLYVNRAYERLWGRSCRSLYDKPMSWMDAIVEEDRGRIMADLAKMVDGGAAAPPFAKYRIARPDGSIRWILARAFPLRNERGELDRIIGLAADITDDKQTDEALLFKENLIECSSSAIATCDLEGNMTYGNTCFIDAWGFDDPKEFLGKSFWKLWLVEERLDEIMQALRDEGTWYGEVKAVRKDGALFDVQVSAAMVFDAEGKPVALTSTSIDITERKRAEEALQESERKFRIAVKTAGLAIWDWNMAENAASWDNSWETLFDGGAQKTTYEWWVERIHPEDRDGVLAAFSDAVAGAEESLVVEYRLRRTDGTWANVYDHAHIMRDDSGRAYRVIGALMDVTGLRRAENELLRARDELEQRIQERTTELSQAVGILNAEVQQRIVTEQTLLKRSEQLRRLAADLMRAEQRERQRLSLVLHDGLQQFLVAAKFRLSSLELASKDADVRRSAKEVGAFLDKSIEVSRSLSNELISPLSRGGLVSSLEWLVGFMRHTHGLAVDFQVDDRLRSASDDVTMLLFQSARELLLNVVKHAGVKAASLRLTRRADRIQLRVADEGTGFDPARLPVEGTGLSNIQERLNLLGGHMEIDSAPGRGAKFVLIAPPEGPL